MKTAINILAFLIANGVGFLSAPVLYNIAVISGLLSPDQIADNPAAFQSSFFTGTIITWLVCAVASLGWFVLKGKLRFLFLLLPAVVPAIYGFNVLNGF